MSIVKKLPVVLIAAVGMSFSFVGTALAQEPIFAEATLGFREDLIIEPPDMRNTKICFKATDNLKPSLMIINMVNPRNPEMLRFPNDMGGRQVTQESDYQCVSISMRQMPSIVINGGFPDDGESQSLRVYVRQE